MQVQSKTLLRCPHMSMSLFFCHRSQNSEPSHFRYMRRVASSVSLPGSYLSAQLPFQMCTHSLRASVAAANLEVYK